MKLNAGRATTVSGIRIRQKGGSSLRVDFTVQYSADVSAWNNTDDSMWSDVDGGATFKESGNFDALFKEPVEAQYIRITMTIPGLHAQLPSPRYWQECHPD